MNYYRIISTVIPQTIVFLFFLQFTSTGIAQTTKNVDNASFRHAFEQIDSLIYQADQPFAAIHKADSLIEIAKSEKNEMYHAKALLYRYNLLVRHRKDSLASAIRGFRKAIHDIRGITEPMLTSNLAEMYLRYLEEHHHTISDRKEHHNDSSDFELWSKTKYKRKITSLFKRSISHKSTRQISLERFSPVLGDTLNTNWYPTYYDLLAKRALDFFLQPPYCIPTGRKYSIQKVLYFSNPSAFYKKNLQCSDPFSLRYNGFATLQELLRLHKGNHPHAFVHYELRRLEYLYQNCHERNDCVLKDKRELYLNALKRLEKKYRGSIAHADIAYKMAECFSRRNKYYSSNIGYIYTDNTDLKTAVNILQNTLNMNAAKTSRAVKACRNFLSILESKYFSVRVPEYHTTRSPVPATIEYRNIDSIKLKAVRLSKEIKDSLRAITKAFYHSNGQLLKPKRIDYLKSLPVEKVWLFNPKEDIDYNLHKEQFRLDDLSCGEYALLSDRDIGGKYGEIDYLTFQVTDLFYLANYNNNDRFSCYLVDQKTGKPMENVEVELLDRYRENYSIAKGMTNADGRFSFSQENVASYYFELSKNNDHLRSIVSPLTTKSFVHFQLNPDRSIYRPGQDIHFKGIELFFDENGRPSVNQGKSVMVTLKEEYGKTFQTKKFETNEFGSFSGTFKAPQNKLGEMVLLSRPSKKQIRVEEYKRPTFEVKLKKPDSSYQIGDQVTVKGIVKNYAGNRVDNARVSYQVEYSSENIQKETTTDNNGEFKIKFDFDPDYKGERDNYRFGCEIKADVTDVTGETHSDKMNFSIKVPDLKIQNDLPHRLDKESLQNIKLTSSKLNGQACSTRGNIKIFKLKPEQPVTMDNNYRSYKKEKRIFKTAFQTKPTTDIELKKNLFQVGKYRIVITGRDANGIFYKTKDEFFVHDLENLEFTSDQQLMCYTKNKTYKPGQEVKLYVYSPLPDATALIQIERNGNVTDYEWADVSDGYFKTIPVKESDEYGFAYKVAMVKKGKLVKKNNVIQVPQRMKKLNIAVKGFDEKVKPGEEESYTIKVTDHKGNPVKAELLANMYDASLDVFGKLNWMKNYYLRYRPNGVSYLRNSSRDFKTFLANKPKTISRSPFSIPFSEFHSLFFGEEVYDEYSFSKDINLAYSISEEEGARSKINKRQENPSSALAEKGKMPLREDFDESVFFKPHLKTNENGEAEISFTMNEALTRWRLMVFAHTKDMKYGYVEKEVETQKKLMVIPNVPRFVREGDEIFFSAKVVNQSDKPKTGAVSLSFTDPVTDRKMNHLIQSDQVNYKFTIPQSSSKSFQWKTLIDTADLDSLQYKLIARTSEYSDGQTEAIPVLPGKIRITESMPMQVNKHSKEQFHFDRFADNQSNTLEDHKLILEFTQNPLWNVIKAMPYLLEYPHGCSEQLLNKLYASYLTSDIIDKYPVIEKVYKKWQEEDNLMEKLQNNEQFRKIAKKEAPGLLNPVKDTKERLENMTFLFKQEKQKEKQNIVLDKLKKMQRNDGSFSWFPGGPSNLYITLYFMEAAHRIRQANNNEFPDRVLNMLNKTVGYTNGVMLQNYHGLIDEAEKKRLDTSEYVPSNMEIYYLYVSSLFPDITSKSSSVQEMYDYYLQKANQCWKDKNIYMKTLIAFTLHNNDKTQNAKRILASLKDYAHNKEETGMYWDYERGTSWDRHYIETHTLLLEAFNKIMNDTSSVSRMKVWLLKNKQTSHWHSTKATASAIHGLLTTGRDWIKESKPVDIKVGNKIITPSKKETEAGTGHFTRIWKDDEITRDKADVEVYNPNLFPVWGAMYWEYFEKMDKITASDNKEMSVNRRLYLVEMKEGKETQKPLQDSLNIKPGDLVLVRLELEVVRDMEYVHMKDLRGACMEPVDDFSRYKYKNGVVYYQSPRDEATHFFFDELEKGSYVFEYKLRVSQAGSFSNGLSIIENMYAPEFRAQSKGTRVQVKRHFQK